MIIRDSDYILMQIKMFGEFISKLKESILHNEPLEVECHFKESLKTLNINMQDLYSEDKMEIFKTLESPQSLCALYEVLLIYTNYHNDNSLIELMEHLNIYMKTKGIYNINL